MKKVILTVATLLVFTSINAQKYLERLTFSDARNPEFFKKNMIFGRRLDVVLGNSSGSAFF